MLEGPRLRQVALVAADCRSVAADLQAAFGWNQPFHDPGVDSFGLTNAVFTVGDTFVEVVAPIRPGTTAGRYLERRGGDSGYMAIFQVPDLAVARQRVTEAGVRVVWTADLGDVAGTHLHPKDVPGALVSIDWADPPDSWRWAGPAWTGTAPPHSPGGIAGVTVEVDDPGLAAARWAEVLGLVAHQAGSEATVHLEDAGQLLRFVPATGGRGEGIVEVQLSGTPVPPGVEIAGVRFTGT